MRHSPEDADDDARMLDERFRDLVVELAPRLRPAPVETIRATVARRRTRKRVALSAAALVLLAGGVGTARGFLDDGSAPRRVEAAATPPTPQGATVPSVAVEPLRETMFPAPREFPLVPGVYENWRVIDTRQAMDDSLGPCASETISGLGAIETRERLYNHSGQGGGLVVLVRYPDASTAERAMADFVDGFARNCPPNPPLSDGNGVSKIRNLDESGAAWRTYGLINGQASYSDYGIVRNGSIIAVANESVIDGRDEPEGDTILSLVKVLERRLESGAPSIGGTAP